MALAARLFKRGVRAMLSGSTLFMKKRHHLTRYVMNEHLASVLEPYGDKASRKVLSIGGSRGLCEILGYGEARIFEADYPAYNILDLPFPSDTYDVVVSDQVLEHVEGDPQRAVDETRRVLKPKGLGVHTTCFVNTLHGAPHDYWRFSPFALTLLCRDFNRILDVGAWGNPWVFVLDWLGMRFQPIPDARWHPLHRIAVRNRESWPVVCWIVAEK